ncbi:uncharacterized protein LOC132788242 [Drosophila nasuta]|uniref:uncharacterized protein LOC132788242 n=1 Tax=Drosophila nasuta TaxID=42062 RepID=UPI00295E367D|nr:uncharacterized protein LOC132788242 [Drosophila nasuta]
MNIHIVVFNTTFKSAKQNISLWRRYNGFRLFMFNITYDFCRLMANNNSKLSFQKIVIDAISENSNINHSCPYKNDVIIRNLIFKDEFLKYLPLPSGEYKYQVTTAVNNIWVHRISVQMAINEKLIARN